MLLAFDHKLMAEAPPASAIFFEFYTRDDTEERVRILYKPDPDTDVPLLLHDGDMSLTDFQSWIHIKLWNWYVTSPISFSNFSELCQVDYTTVEDYGSCYAWQRDYY